MKPNPLWICLRVLLAAILLIAICTSVRRGLAAWEFRKGDPTHVQAAIQFDPGNPEYPAQLASLTHLYSDAANSQEIVRLYQRATQLDPHDAQYWADLASALEWAGEPAEALKAFNHALVLFPNSPDLNWQFANFCIRQGELSRGLGLLKVVLRSRTMPSKQVFALAQRATPDALLLIGEMLPHDSGSVLDFLYYEVEANNAAGAADAWAFLLRSNYQFTLKQSLPYLDALIDWRDSRSLLDAWNTLQTKFPDQISSQAPPGNLITNGDFSKPILNDALDWRITPVTGITVARDGSLFGGEGGSLRIDFTSARNAEPAIVFQTVPVMPNKDYAFSVHVRLKDLGTGVQFQIIDPKDTSKLFVSTDYLYGTIADTEQHIKFHTPSSTRLIVVMLSGSAGHIFDANNRGTAWIGRVKLWLDDAKSSPISSRHSQGFT